MTGYKSIWIGVDSAGYNSTSTGQHNLMMLDSAGWSNTTGHNNISSVTMPDSVMRQATVM